MFKIIVFAPHPDDESYGAGGSIMKWLEEGHEFHIIWFTDGRAGYRKAREQNALDDCEETKITEDELAGIRLAEADAAGEFLGVKKENRHFLKFYDSELQNHINDAIEKIKDIVRDADLFVIPSSNNDHSDHQATHDIAVKVAQELNLNRLKFYVYNLYNPLKAQGENLVKIKIGDKRFKVYQALKLHKSQFYTKDMKWQTEAMKERRRERFGVF
ncbi:MAG: PIG-L family deacetylase, partial [Candidatus Lokiarchaeota archaeon]|nr:PIG-L family deacetylase [Candidatus Lokiarchaeota archaeon]